MAQSASSVVFDVIAFLWVKSLVFFLSSMMHLLLVLLCLQYATGRNIKIDVGAPWPRYSTSYVLELSEFLFDHSPNSFWQFVDKICLHSDNIDNVLSVSSDSNQSDRDKIEEIDSLAFAAASEIVQPAMHTLMQTMVKNRYLLIEQQLFSISSPFLLYISCYCFWIA